MYNVTSPRSLISLVNSVPYIAFWGTSKMGKKTGLQGFVNNKGADQPAHPHRLISAFVIRFLESTISKLASSEISMF